jgi:MerR family transcriptional regulator, thiopeptide resistance regulator
MTYTVKQLAKLSGISARTLHFYDEIGLLKPAYYGENKYRYYQEEQLLLLQQILFYRELDFPLDDIRRILTSDTFDKVAALQSHKEILTGKLERLQKLHETIDKTIAHLRGEITMQAKELYYGFDSEQQKQYEQQLVEQGVVDQSFIDASHQKINNWSTDDKENFIKEMEDINKAFIAALTANRQAASREVQALVKRHITWIRKSWQPNRQSYIGLGKMYQTPEFRKFYETRYPQHPELVDFIVDAMEIYANTELTK